MLTKRLQKLLDLVPACGTLADVGCDHGYIGCGALERAKVQNTIFIDISAPSLQKAQLLAQQKGIEDKCTFLCRDGLQDAVCDCAVVAGMGGLEIISVLQGADSLPFHLVLQPMRSSDDVRRYLQQHYKIVTDEKIFDGKFYDVIYACKAIGGDCLTQEEIQFGRSNLQNPKQDFVLFLQTQMQQYQQIYQQCGNAEVLEKLQTLQRVFSKIQEEQQ